MPLVSKTYYLNTLTQRFYISLSATLTTVFTSVRLKDTYKPVNMNSLAYQS